jgi:hypothetical protein
LKWQPLNSQEKKKRKNPGGGGGEGADFLLETGDYGRKRSDKRKENSR